MNVAIYSPKRGWLTHFDYPEDGDPVGRFLRCKRANARVKKFTTKISLKNAMRLLDGVEDLQLVELDEDITVAYRRESKIGRTGRRRRFNRLD